MVGGVFEENDSVGWSIEHDAEVEGPPVTRIQSLGPKSQAQNRCDAAEVSMESHKTMRVSYFVHPRRPKRIW